jgi:hypothetical protein
MIATDAFSRFGRRMASTQGCPYVTIAVTPNPIRQLDETALRVRAEAMIGTVIDGLTLPPGELERRLHGVAEAQINPAGVVRAATPV